jgi:uncharacterized protein (TIGR00251 family)
VGRDGSRAGAASPLLRPSYDGAVAVSAEILRSHPDGVLVAVWVVPGAAREEVVGFYGRALRVRVTAPAEGGRANRAAAVVVARALGGRRGEVVSGQAARRKLVLVFGVEVVAAAERLDALFADR